MQCEKKDLTHISLFAGIAGIDLAAGWAGFRTILFVEIEEYCQKVLKKHWPDVPIIGDIRDVTKETIANAFIWSNREITQPNQRKVSSSDGKSTKVSAPSNFAPSVTLATGGFPCQPVSTAGKRRGKEDDRWLWPEMLRVISEVRPTWVVAENVTGLLHLGFNDCISDLEGKGYETISFIVPACAVNAPHRRDRIFLVAYDNTGRFNDGGFEGQGIQRGQQTRYEDRASREDVADTNRQSRSERNKHSTVREQASLGNDTTRYGLQEWWTVEPELGRVAYGIPHRVNRLKCLGNAVVPQQIYPILKAIADIENGKKR